jgi:hypothetical protein
MKLDNLKYTLDNKIKTTFNNTYIKSNKNNCRTMTNLMILKHTHVSKFNTEHSNMAKIMK